MIDNEKRIMTRVTVDGNQRRHLYISENTNTSSFLIHSTSHFRVTRKYQLPMKYKEPSVDNTPVSDTKQIGHSLYWIHTISYIIS